MKIVEMKVGDLVPYENNPRNNDNAVDVVAASIKQFGFRVPIVIDKENVVVAGHTRLLAAQKLGLKKVPCVIANDLSEKQIREFRLVDNKVAEASSWDWDKLDEELALIADLPDDGFPEIDMADFGFDMSHTREGGGGDDDIDSFFEVAPGTPAGSDGSKTERKKVQSIACPHCGEVFEIEV